MRARQLETLLSALGSWSASDLEVRMTQLRTRNLLPKGGRGQYAPEIGAGHAAAVLIALGAAARAVDAGERVLEYMDLVPLEAVDAIGTATLHDALMTILNSPDLAYRVGRVRVCRSWPEATIELMDDQGAAVATTYQRSDRPGSESFIREDLTFDGALIHQLAIVLKTGGARAAYQE